MSALPRALGQEEESGTPKVTPLLLLTGFLGSGKTTLLRHLVSDPELGPDLAVIVNDLGELGLDHELIAAASDI